MDKTWIKDKFGKPTEERSSIDERPCVFALCPGYAGHPIGGNIANHPMLAGRPVSFKLLAGMGGRHSGQAGENLSDLAFSVSLSCPSIPPALYPVFFTSNHFIRLSFLPKYRSGFFY